MWCECTSRIGWCPSWLTGFPLGAFHNSSAGIFLYREQSDTYKEQGLQKPSCSWLWALSFSPWRAMCSWLWFFQLTTSEIQLKIVKFGKQHGSLSMHFGQIVICSSSFSLVKYKLASVSCSSFEDTAILIRFPKIGYISCAHLFSYSFSRIYLFSLGKKSS